MQKNPYLAEILKLSHPTSCCFAKLNISMLVAEKLEARRLEFLKQNWQCSSFGLREYLKLLTHAPCSLNKYFTGTLVGG